MPVIDEKYYYDRRLDCGSEEKGIWFTFEEIEATQNGDPILTLVSFNNKFASTLLFNITFNDSYQTIINKIGKQADYRGGRFVKNFRKWFIKGNERNLFVNILFHDNDLQSFDELSIQAYNSNEDYSTLIPNKE